MEALVQQKNSKAEKKSPSESDTSELLFSLRFKPRILVAIISSFKNGLRQGSGRFFSVENGHTKSCVDTV